MTLLNLMVADYSERFGNRLSLPEHRQIELYAQKKRVPFAEDETASPSPVAGLLGISTILMLLDATLDSRDPSLEGKPSWQRYQSLPKRSTTDKMVAEVYRILRIVRLASQHLSGHADLEDGVIKLFCTYNRCALTLNITPLGLELLRSFVVYYLDSVNQPYSDAYVEAMLLEYFLDIVGEIKSFADEDRVLFQFRRKYHFSRTLRLDCDTPRHTTDGTTIRFEIAAAFANAARYPIDIFSVIDDALHIIPVEALTDFSLPITDLAPWKVRNGGTTLPPHFRLRFGRQVQVVGLPMT